MALLHSNLEPASNFFSTYLQCQISLRKVCPVFRRWFLPRLIPLPTSNQIISNSNWINTFLLSPSQSCVFRSSLQQLLSSTFTMLNCFHRLHPLHLICIQQTRIKAMALQLIAIIHGTNVSALGLCEAFLSEIAILKRLSTEHGVKLNDIVSLMIDTTEGLNPPRPGSVARALQPIFLTSSLAKICDLVWCFLQLFHQRDRCLFPKG